MKLNKCVGDIYGDFVYRQTQVESTYIDMVTTFVFKLYLYTE
jgi:hypothetical protein